MSTSHTIAQTKTTSEVAAAIEQMRAVLAKSYGCDFAFLVLARGELLGASTLNHGEVRANADAAA
jgi:hypothetical protein